MLEVSYGHLKETLMGRPRKFETPEVLMNDCLKYFKYARDNPLKEAKFYTNDGCPGTHDMDKLRVFNLWGLTTYIGIVERTWYAWKDAKNSLYRPDLIHVMGWAEGVIRSQQVEGATSGLLKEQIVSRLLGLADKKEHTGPDGSPIPLDGMTSNKELARRMLYILAAGVDEMENDT